MSDRRIIHDPLHGSISFEGVYMDLLGRHEFQRLHQIKQLGQGNKVFPGANHTRFEHSMGVYHLSGRMANVLGLSDDEKRAVQAAGLLHDICHPPYSHVMEETMEHALGKDHMEIAKELIFGSIPTHMKRDDDIVDDKFSIAEVLERNGIDPQLVCDLIMLPSGEHKGIETFGETNQAFFANKDYLHQTIHGPVDADQMDYLVRDAHYTGVAFGAIDTERLLSQMVLFNNKLVLRKGGIMAAEGLMVSRALMYSSVYYHKTVRIVEKMIIKAAELSGMDFSELYLMNDIDFVNGLMQSNPVSSRLVRMVIDRKFYKKAYTLYTNSLTEDGKTSLLQYFGYEKRKKLELDIAEAADLDISQITLDLPSRSTLLSQIKIGKTDVLILDNDKIKPITRYSTLAKSLQSRNINDWAVMVACPEEHREKVAKACRDIIGIDNRE